MLRRSILLALVVTGWGASSSAVRGDAPAEPDDMVPLFNGRDLQGWDGDPRLWSVRDGAIRGETTEHQKTDGNTFLIYQPQTLADFELRLSFRCNATNNSGIQYRSSRVSNDHAANRWVVHGYQHEIRNEVRLPDVAGFIYDEGGSRGRLCLIGEHATWGADGQKSVLATFMDQTGFEKTFRLNDWNDVVIIAQGSRFRHYLNNTLVVDFTDRDPQHARQSGILALQLHAGAPMWAEFRSIRMRPNP